MNKKEQKILDRQLDDIADKLLIDGWRCTYAIYENETIEAYVLRDIRNVLKQGIQQSNFGLSFIVRELLKCLRWHLGTNKDPYQVYLMTGEETMKCKEFIKYKED